MPDFNGVGPQLRPEDYDLGHAGVVPPQGGQRGRYVKTEDIKRAVEGRAADIVRGAGVPVRGHGHINCPYHDHPDRDPSFRVREDGTSLVCTCRNVHSVFDALMVLEGLDFEGAKIRAAELLGRSDLIVDRSKPKPRADSGDDDKGLTLQRLSTEFMLPIDVLQAFGWFGMGRRGEKHDKDAVGIWYKDANGNQTHLRLRFKLNGKKGKFGWKKGHTNAPLYGAWMARAMLAAEGYAVLLEGESDCVTCWHNGVPALGLPGAGNWSEERHAATLEGAQKIYVIIEQDTGGTAVLKWLARSSIRDRVLLVKMPSGIKDPRALWLQCNGDPAKFTERFRACLDAAEVWNEEKRAVAAAAIKGKSAGQVSHLNIWFFAPNGDYYNMKTGEHWPGKSVDKCADIPDATAIIDADRQLHQKTWAPGLPVVIEDKLISKDGQWKDAPGFRVLNEYAPPEITLGNPDDVEPWLGHLQFIFPNDWKHIIQWLAHRVQKPGEKLNHVLVLGGGSGIGKDTILQPAHYAVGGVANFKEISAAVVGERFNPFLRCVILRVNEARDFGDLTRYSFYEHMKEWGAAPPDFLRVDDKNVKAYQIANVVGIIITTNYLQDGLYIPADDRRHYIAWSDIETDKETDRFVCQHRAISERFGGSVKEYFERLYAWFEAGGKNNVAAYLSQPERLAGFNAKASPPRTAAFLAMADSSKPQEESELADLLDAMGRPPCVPVAKMIQAAHLNSDEIELWLKDRRNGRKIAPAMARCGYEPVRNPNDKRDGLWMFAGRRTAAYVLATIPPGNRLNVVRAAIPGNDKSCGDYGDDPAASNQQRTDEVPDDRFMR
jgi:hypothetical protein